jgi:hypothetical protein
MTYADERDRYPHPLPARLRLIEAKTSPDKTTGHLGLVGGAAPVQVDDRTPRTRDRVLVVIYLVLSLATVLSMVDLPVPRDCVSLQSAFQVADLHLCGAVPQSSPIPEVTR